MKKMLTPTMMRKIKIIDIDNDDEERKNIDFDNDGEGGRPEFSELAG